MQGVKEKILDGFEFKKHIDTAAELNPSDHITHHLLGRFCFEVSQVNAKLGFLWYRIIRTIYLYNFFLQAIVGNDTLELGVV